jgi:hypothetical protein
MLFFSISTLVAVLLGALVAVAVFFLLPLLKSGPGIRIAAFVTAGLYLLVIGGSIVNWFLLNQQETPVITPATLPQRSLSTSPVSKLVIRDTAIYAELNSHQLLGPTIKSYVQTFPANTGFRIVAANVVPISAIGVSGLSVDIVGDGEAVTVRFQLKSGPLVDRYRGSFNARLELTEESIARSVGEGSVFLQER